LATGLAFWVKIGLGVVKIFIRIYAGGHEFSQPVYGGLRSATQFFAVQTPADGGESPAYSAGSLRSSKIGGLPARRGNPRSLPGGTPPRASLDWNHLAEVVEIAVRFLDNVISAARYPLAKVDRVVKGNRKIGLGVMGWADLLVKMQIPYDSQEALDLAERVVKFITKTAHETSEKLGKEKGNFPNFVGSRWQKRVKSIRNATCTTIAPTGSISMVAGVSSGIEPLFALSYYKEVMGGVRLPEVNQDLMEMIGKIDGQTSSQILKIKQEILKTGSIQKIKEIPEKIRRVFATAHEISPTFHVKMQAAFQKYTDNAVSKTINLPYEATVEDVEQAFVLAWKLGCKGITIYRDKSRKNQVLNVGTSEARFRPARRARFRESIDQTISDLCPNCGRKLTREEGCLKCQSCGFTACEI